jgi:hypothetical protein
MSQDPNTKGTFSFVMAWAIATKHPTPHGVCPMMTYRKLGEYVTAEPFRPFRIRMASGQFFDVRHPEMILVGRTSARVHSVIGAGLNEKWHDASMLLMETIEPLDAHVPHANG